jgi:hypothetical protein
LKNNCCFLKTTKPITCTYKHGFLHVCYCPTRYELFERYKI